MPVWRVKARISDTREWLSVPSANIIRVAGIEPPEAAIHQKQAYPKVAVFTEGITAGACRSPRRLDGQLEMLFEKREYGQDAKLRNPVADALVASAPPVPVLVAAPHMVAIRHEIGPLAGLLQKLPQADRAAEI